jgi:hypothetical protein
MILITQEDSIIITTPKIISTSLHPKYKRNSWRALFRNKCKYSIINLGILKDNNTSNLGLVSCLGGYKTYLTLWFSQILQI